MAIAIDASTPALKYVTSGTLTSASFIAPAGALLVHFMEITWTTSATATQPTAGTGVADSGGLTWYKASERTPISSCGYTGIWWAVTTGSSSRTCSISNPGTAANKISQVMVFTGADTTTPIGVTGSGTGTAAPNWSLTSTSTGSWAWGAGLDPGGSATTYVASTTGTTVRSTRNANEGFGCFYSTVQSTAVGQSLTIAMTGPTEAQGWSLAEILPPAAAPDGGPPMRSRLFSNKSRSWFPSGTYSR